MLKLIIGVKGTGKTKALIEGVNKATEESKGSVVCLEKGNKLTFDVKHQCRLIDTDQYAVTDASALYGMLAGILASNHDVTHVFIDSALKMCGNDIASFDSFLEKANTLVEKIGCFCEITSSIPAEEATEIEKKYL